MVVMKKITKEEYVNKHFNKKFKLIDDSCFKYVNEGFRYSQRGNILFWFKGLW